MMLLILTILNGSDSRLEDLLNQNLMLLKSFSNFFGEEGTQWNRKILDFTLQLITPLGRLEIDNLAEKET